MVPTERDLTTTWLRALRTAILSLAICAVAATASRADRKNPMPPGLEGVGITEKRDAQVPLNLEFTDTDGKKVKLSEIFDGTVPVILTMNYSNCPKLCSLQLNGLLDTLRQMNFNLGQEYRIVTISIDPRESPERSKLTKQKYLQDYGRPGSGSGWRFLTTRNEDDIHKVADTVGFGYVQIPGTQDYAHAAVLMICTPDGRVSRYLGGVEYLPQTLRLSLIEAGEGKIGSTWDQVLMYCYHYDAEANRYSPVAVRLMQIGGALTVLVLGIVLGLYWVRYALRARRHRPAHESA